MELLRLDPPFQMIKWMRSSSESQDYDTEKVSRDKAENGLRLEWDEEETNEKEEQKKK